MDGNTWAGLSGLMAFVSAIAAICSARSSHTSAESADKSVRQSDRHRLSDEIQFFDDVFQRSRGPRTKLLIAADSGNDDWKKDREKAKEIVREVARSFNLARIATVTTAGETLLVQEWGRHAAKLWIISRPFVQKMRDEQGHQKLFAGFQKLAQEGREEYPDS